MTQTTITTQTFHEVTTLAGGTLKLLMASEKTFYETARDAYLAEYTFPMANDLRTLDRLLAMEVQMQRLQFFTLSGTYYDGIDIEPKEEGEMRRSMKELASQIADTQTQLGVSKSQRDKAATDSVGAYIEQIRVAAREHGVMREKQLGKALELTKQLFSLTGAFIRSNEEERRKLGFEKGDDIVTWVEDYMRPEFDAIDAYFRENQARFYRRSL